jgi:hypothetical protein
MFVFVFLCCVVLCRGICDVLPSVLIRSRNLRCEAAKVLTRTVEPLMMMMMMMIALSKLVIVLNFLCYLDRGNTNIFAGHRRSSLIFLCCIN